METKSQSLEKVRQYAEKIKGKEYDGASSSGSAAYEAQLENTLSDLANRVTQQEAALDQLKSQAGSSSISHPSPDVNIRLQQLKAITLAYQKLTPSEPQLPASNSSIPALLAVRNARKLVSEIRELIPSTHSALSAARKDLSKERSNLEDASLLASALEQRITQLRSVAAQRSEQTADEIVSNLTRTEKERKDSYEESAKALFLAMVHFIETTLAPMLAAEELGGPVAGSVLDIDNETLASGYTARGKVEKSKSASDQDNRQLRIDQVWGLRNVPEKEANKDHDRESKAAAEDARALVEDLLNAAVGQGSGAYVTLERESAAARFLVRAKAAMLHPRDARRIRLMDFGRILDD